MILDANQNCVWKEPCAAHWAPPTRCVIQLLLAHFDCPPAVSWTAPNTSCNSNWAWTAPVTSHVYLVRWTNDSVVAYSFLSSFICLFILRRWCQLHDWGLCLESWHADAAGHNRLNGPISFSGYTSREAPSPHLEGAAWRPAQTSLSIFFPSTCCFSASPLGICLPREAFPDSSRLVSALPSELSIPACSTLACNCSVYLSS